MLSPSANQAVLRARNHPSLACRTRRRSLDVRTSLHNFPTESLIAPSADLSALIPLIGVRAIKESPSLAALSHHDGLGNAFQTSPLRTTIQSRLDRAE